ncbi:alpha/beta hydrolase family protein [Arenimonas oryziterrae]|uniref:Peptidase S9 prolyl oligopeptidase catalytic domain-containing protein n=1 Tax=Arenimonas oryziterrae DSM 21050 = YC6267 TaxID=1121015 RepID=A0A091AZE8_9GAMM|nr:prolyl oligopeptidase family serine peptidase [Arenimonas oryziterrae]KFN44821.1 hypothetical protein N789_02055 [Arenimonas oryziterrae DSM 21050 = YC6267]
MTQQWTRALTAASLALIATGSLAQTPKLPAETFAKHSEYLSAELSPNGDYVAAITSEGEKLSLSLIHLDGGFETKMVRLGPKEAVSNTTWTSDNRIVIAKASQGGYLGDLPRANGELMATNADAEKSLYLYGYNNARGRDQGFGQVIHVIDDAPGEVLVSVSEYQSRASERETVILRMNTITGSRREIERMNFAGGVMADHNAVPRFILANDEKDEPEIHYRKSASDKGWAMLPKTIAGYSFSPLYFEKDNNIVIAAISDHKEPDALYRVDLAQGTRTKLIGNPDFEIGGMLYAGFDRRPFGVFYNTGKPSVQYLDPNSEWAQLHAALMKQFPGEMLNFTSFSKNDRKLIFTVYSDRHPGAYYLFDRDAKKIKLLFEAQSWVDPKLMASRRPVEFQAKDGTKLYGVLTVPNGVQGPQPMVVLPHGGPYDIKDDWSYDADAQFLANRGYAVLQVNFRGSGGRGVNFVESGYRQWGKLIQDDIADGAKWAIAQNIADGKRVCIYGASFGGYSALMNPIRYPDLYRCAIGYVGVYDLSTEWKAGDTNDTVQGRRFLERVIGHDPAELDAQSPAKHADALTLPVMLIHGKDDWRVPMEQFDALSTALKGHGIGFESIVKNGEGHGYYKLENRVEVYDRIDAFLQRYNAPK